MSDTFTQLYVQIVFSTKYRNPTLLPRFRADVFRYISGIITHLNQKSIIVNGVSDHIHILIGHQPSISISELVKRVKQSSANYINSQDWLPHNFQWQKGYGAFSYSNEAIDKVYRYILNQESHHQDYSFEEEYLFFLQEASIQTEGKCIFDFQT